MFEAVAVLALILAVLAVVLAVMTMTVTSEASAALKAHKKELQDHIYPVADQTGTLGGQPVNAGDQLPHGSTFVTGTQGDSSGDPPGSVPKVSSIGGPDAPAPPANRKSRRSGAAKDRADKVKASE